MYQYTYYMFSFSLNRIKSLENTASKVLNEALSLSRLPPAGSPLRTTGQRPMGFVPKNIVPLSVIAKQALYEALSFGSPGGMNTGFGQRLGMGMNMGMNTRMGGGIRRPNMGRNFGGFAPSMGGRIELPSTGFKDKWTWPGGGLGGGGFGGGGLGGGGFGGGGFGGNPLDVPMFAPGEEPRGGGGFGGGGLGDDSILKLQHKKDLETSPMQSPFVGGDSGVRRPEEPLGTKPVEQPDSENNPDSPNYRPPSVEGEKTGGAGLGQETFGTKDPEMKKGLEAARAKMDADEDAKMQQELSPAQYAAWKTRKTAQFNDQLKKQTPDIARRSKAAAEQRAGNLEAEKTQQDTSLSSGQKTLITRSQRSSGRGKLADLAQKSQREAEEGKLGRMEGAPMSDAQRKRVQSGLPI